MTSAGKKRLWYGLLVVSSCALVFAWAFNTRVKDVREVRADFMSMVYSGAFQKRFSLPRAGVYALDPGLHAIAVRVVRVPFWGHRRFLDAYVDSALDIDYPAGTSGRIGDDWVYGLMFFLVDRPDSDFAARTARWRGFPATWMIRSKAYRPAPDGYGIVADGGIDEYDRDILPGLSVITIKATPAMLTPDYGPTQLWLRRRGKPAIDERAPNPEHGYGFTIPEPLFRHAAEAAHHTARFQPYQPGKPAFTTPARSDAQDTFE